jgi:hypothetical protein
MNHLPRLLLALVALNLCACTTFDREWRMWSPPTPPGSRTVMKKYEPAPTPQSPFDGRWLGRWTSERHNSIGSKKPAGGEVQCVFTRIDPYRYRANFRAEWLIFRGDYLATLYGHQTGSTTLRLHGTQSVNCLLGGEYRYDGTVTPTHFTLRYNSSHDTGTLEMRKVR